jgi:hypothetical protein
MAAELITNGGFETTTYTQSHQFGPGSPAAGSTAAGATDISGWTGTNIGRNTASGSTNNAGGAPFNLLYKPITTGLPTTVGGINVGSAPANNVSAYGVTYNNNTLSKTPLSSNLLEPINQYYNTNGAGSGTALSFMLSQGCGYSGTGTGPTASNRTDTCASNLSSTATIGTHPTAPAGTTYNFQNPTSTASNFKLSPNGGNFVSLDGDFNFDGELQYRNITGLVNGQSYTIGFWWAATEVQGFHLDTTTNPSTPLTARIQYRLGNNSGTASNVCDTTTGPTPGAGGACLFSTATVTQNVAHTFTGWIKESVTFRYVGTTGASLTLAFLSIGSPNINTANGAPPMALLDGVSLANAPEPATLAILSVGLAGVIFVRRPRRRPAAQAA